MAGTHPTDRKAEGGSAWAYTQGHFSRRACASSTTSAGRWARIRRRPLFFDAHLWSNRTFERLCTLGKDGFFPCRLILADIATNKARPRTQVTWV
ncbi:hypothetical protein RSAG8_13447, partial [Rhizoctonia solani AG-8 WAC10335]